MALIGGPSRRTETVRRAHCAAESAISEASSDYATHGGIEANPHQSHNGELDCAVCHHMHKASEKYCIQCHSQYDFKVP